MQSIPALSLVRNGDVEKPPVTPPEAELVVRKRLEVIVAGVYSAGNDDALSFMAFERKLREQLFALGCALVVLFLVVAEQRIAASIPARLKLGTRVFRRSPAQTRSVNTMFGVVRYTRLYMREAVVGAKKKRRGFHPVDAALGLGHDRMSMHVLALAARMATKLSFAEAKNTTGLAIPVAPSTEVIEQTVLGLGRHSQAWFEQRPRPEGDGDVLIIQIDSKGAPTATASELERRRGERRKRPDNASPRHRSRERRKRWPKKARRKKGDKSKNAKMATMFVMFTLKREGGKLLGPINRVVYASFATKAHVFAVARREANKRGFEPGSGKTIQLLTDGELCFATNAKKYFPEAIHTVDVVHIIEKLWAAGACIHREGSAAQKSWVELQKERLYDGRLHLVIDALRGQKSALAKSGHSTKWKLAQLARIQSYIEKRVAHANYKSLLAADLEIATGMVEGAIKHVIGKRCDHGGMRWIKERVEALLQLRCIEINGDWDAFIARVHDENWRAAREIGERRRLQANEPAALPKFTSSTKTCAA